jgi:hypothetical protein
MAGMEASRIPLEVEAPLGAPAFDDLATSLAELGYEPRRTGTEFVGAGPAGEGSPHIALTLRQPIPPDAANVLLERVSTWIRQRPAPKGRFRRRHPRPITVTITGPNGEVLSRGVVERS